MVHTFLVYSCNMKGKNRRQTVFRLPEIGEMRTPRPCKKERAGEILITNSRSFKGAAVETLGPYIRNYIGRIVFTVMSTS